MIELNKEQIGKLHIYMPESVKKVNGLIVDRANQARVLQMQKDNSRFLQMYDKITHFIKLNQTTVLPSFHARNKISNTYQNWLGIGRQAFDWDFQKEAFKTVRGKGDNDALLAITKADGTRTSMTWADLYEEAKRYDVVDEGFFAQDVGVGEKSSGLFKKLPASLDPTDTNDFILYRKGAQIGSLIENQDRLIHFAAQVSNGKTFEEAAESVDKYLFNYSDLTAFEKSVMKRIFPYYTWLRKNAALQLEVLLENPKKFQYVSKLFGGIESMTNPDERINKGLVNDFAKDWVQTPFTVTNPEGRKEPVLWNPNLPIMDINRIPDPTRPVQSLKSLFTQTNPLIKVPVEQAINRNVFFEQPIVNEGDNEAAKRLDHILSQFAMYGTLGDFMQKDGADLGLHTLNSTTGVKMLSYDYDKYKMQKIKELTEKNKKKK
jgi:hypothetical protein